MDNTLTCAISSSGNLGEDAVESREAALNLLSSLLILLLLEYSDRGRGLCHLRRISGGPKPPDDWLGLRSSCLSSLWLVCTGRSMWFTSGFVALVTGISLTLLDVSNRKIYIYIIYYWCKIFVNYYQIRQFINRKISIFISEVNIWSCTGLRLGLRSSEHFNWQRDIGTFCIYHSDFCMYVCGVVYKLQQKDAFNSRYKDWKWNQDNWFLVV